MLDTRCICCSLRSKDHNWGRVESEIWKMATVAAQFKEPFPKSHQKTKQKQNNTGIIFLVPVLAKSETFSDTSKLQKKMEVTS